MNALRKIRRVAWILAAALTLVFVTTPGASAETQGATVRFSNDVVQGTCALNVTDEDAQSGAVTATLGAGASAKGLRNYLDTAYTEVNCRVFGVVGGTFGVSVASHEAHTQGPLLLQDRTRVILPGFDKYLVCGQAKVRQRDGSVHLTPEVCGF